MSAHAGILPDDPPEVVTEPGQGADEIIACAGGGSNFAGSAMPYLGRKIKGQSQARVVAVEPAACPTLRGTSSTTLATPAT